MKKNPSLTQFIPEIYKKIIIKIPGYFWDVTKYASREIEHSNHVDQSLVSSHRKSEGRNNESQLNPTQQKQSCYEDQQYPPLPRQNFCPNICKENIGFPENMLKFLEKIRHSNHVVHPRLVRAAPAVEKNREQKLKIDAFREKNQLQQWSKTGSNIMADE